MQKCVKMRVKYLDEEKLKARLKLAPHLLKINYI